MSDDETWSAEEGSDDAAQPEGPAIYRVRLFFDVPADGDDLARQKSIAEALWERREKRRTRYEDEYGARSDWPADHPTTVINIKRPESVEAAVCIRCDWLKRSPAAGKAVDLHAAAKAHALAHPHDPLLEDGINPPKKAKHAGIQGLLDQAREQARAAARRAAKRESE